LPSSLRCNRITRKVYSHDLEDHCEGQRYHHEIFHILPSKKSWAERQEDSRPCSMEGPLLFLLVKDPLPLRVHLWWSDHDLWRLVCLHGPQDCRECPLFVLRIKGPLPMRVHLW
jgi:hypothetical protein